MDSKQLRQKFIDFFIERNHQEVPPASLIPENDPSVLFTTAGMQQFKKFYASSEEAPAKNLVTCQPCFRTSDIEEVGDDTHLTFFEMLGNFSFDDYFKKEAVDMAVEFLTQELRINLEDLEFYIFGGDKETPRDKEAEKILKDKGITRIKEGTRFDNFWGPTGKEGPCGPTIDIYFKDIEIWSLVFNEYYKNSDGQYRSLKTRGVDTGMGLERMLVVLEKKNNIYETDLFLPLIENLEEISGKNYENFQDEFRIITDHIKAATFLINDEILPANKERGYIVRRLIRRAIVKGVKLEINDNITAKIAEKVFEIYENIYQFKKEEIISVLNTEENKFRKTLRAGLKLIHSKEKITGQDLFNFYQSFGIPSEIAEEEVRETQIEITGNAPQEFKELFQKHQDLSRAASAGMFKGGLAGGGGMETKYHTATHLLLASLRQVLGPDVAQKGSNITAERLRFDFNFSEKLSDEQIKKIEDLVNENIKQDLPVKMEEMSLEDAKNCGALGEFGQKYGLKVKVYTMGDFSKEICGGPHIKSTGELGHFKIIKEESSSAGIRRIKAVLE